MAPQDVGGSLRCLIQGYRFRDAAQGAALSQRPALIDAGPRPGRSSSRNGGALTSRSDESHDAEQGMLGAIAGEPALGRGPASDGDYSGHEYHPHTAR